VEQASIDPRTRDTRFKRSPVRVPEWMRSLPERTTSFESIWPLRLRCGKGEYCYKGRPIAPSRSPPRYFVLGGVANFMSEGADAAVFGFSFFGVLASRLLRP
jgi:hypothetical protein